MTGMWSLLFFCLEVREFLADEKRFAWCRCARGERVFSRREAFCLVDVLMFVWWDRGGSLFGGALPTPGPGDTDAGTWWAHFEPIEQSALACFKTAPFTKLLRRQVKSHH